MDEFQLGRIVLTKFFCALYGSDITDVSTCHELMRTDVARSLSLEIQASISTRNLGATS